ncbi:MFS transporter [Candidatus Avelusimicrobium sp.]
MIKIISLVLSFSILFTSVAPSYAQALDAMEQERIGAGFTHWQSEFLTTSFNEVFEAEVAKHAPGVQLEDLKKLVDDLELFTDPGFNPSSLGIEPDEEMTYERFAQEYKTQMKADANSAALLEMIGDDAEYQKLLNQEIKKAYAEYEADVAKFEAQEMEQMKSLIKQVWDNRKKYSQDDQDWLAFEGMPFLYGIGLLDKATAESVAGVVRSVVKNAESDCSKVGVWTGMKAMVGAKDDLNAQNARCERALKAIIPLGILGKAAKGKDRGDATLIGRFMIGGYRGLAGAGVAMVGTQALLGLNGGQELATFLLRAPVDPEAEKSYALQILNLGLDGLSPISLYGDLEYEDAFYSYWTTKPLAYTFYEDDDGNVRNIFYDIGQVVAELSKEGDSTAKYVVEKVNRAQTAYHWDKMGGTGQLEDPMEVMGLNSKFFVAGTLKGGYEFDEELKRRCTPQKRSDGKCGYKDGYYEYPNTHGVLMDYEWEDRLAWTCGAVNTARLPSWGNGGAVPLPLARGGYLAYRMRLQLIADDTIAPSLKAEIANTLARHYNKYARACNNIMEAVATGTQKHAYHTVTDKQWAAYNTQIVDKTTGKVLRRKSDNEILSTNYTAATFEDSWKKGEANRAQAKKTQEATKWAQLAADVILIFVTGGYSLVKGVIKAPVKMMKWGVRTIKAARAATASKNILKGLKILVRNHRFLKYGTTSLRKAMANRITYSWSRFKLGIKPEVLMTFGEKQTLNALRVKGAAAYSRELMHAARVGQQAMTTRAPLLARSAAEEVKWLNETMQAQKVLGIDGAKGFRIAANQVGKLSPTPANTIRLTQAVPQGYSVRVLEGAEVLGKSPSARLSAVELYEARNGVGFKKSAQRFLQGAKAKVHKVGQRMGLISEKSGSYVKVGQNYYKVGYGQTVVDLNGELRVAEIGQELVLDGQGIFVPYGKQAVRVVGRPMFADADLSLEQIAKNLKLNKTAVRPAVNGSSIAFEQRPFWKNGVTKKAVEGIKVAQGPLMEVDDFATGYNRVRNAYTTRRVEVPQMQARWDAQLNGYVVEQGAGTRMVEELVPVQGRSRVAVASERTLSPAELQAREHSQARAAYQRQQRVLREEGNLRAGQELQASYMAQLEENSAKDAARAAYEATEKGKAAVAARQRKAFQWERFYNKVDKYTFGVGGKALRMLNQKATYMAAAMIMNTSSPAVANTAAAVSTLAADVRPVVTMVDPLMFERGGSMLVGGGRVVGGPSLITKGAPRFATAAEQAASVAKQGSQLSRQGAAFRVLQQQRAESILTASMARLQAVSQGGFGLVDGVGYALNNAMNAFKYFSPVTAIKYIRNPYYIAHERVAANLSQQIAVQNLLQKQQTFQIQQSLAELQIEQAAVPVVAYIQHNLKSAAQNLYFNLIAPIEFAKNPHYQAHIARLSQAAATAKATNMAQGSLQPEAVHAAVKSVGQVALPAERKSGLKAFFTRKQNHTDPYQSFWESVSQSIPSISVKETAEILRRNFEGELQGVLAVSIIPHNHQLEKIFAGRDASRYAKEADAIIQEARRQAVVEFMETYGERLESLNNDERFVEIYTLRAKAAIENSKLPAKVQAVILEGFNTTIERWRNSSSLSVKGSISNGVVSVPVYNLQGKYKGSLEVPAPKGLILKSTQTYFIVAQGDGTGEMYVREYEDAAQDDGKSVQTLIRNDIPLKSSARQANTNELGVKKIMEGLLMINNRLWPMMGLYLLAGMGNVSTVISTFAKESFVMTNVDMYLMGGVSTVAMGFMSLLAGILQNRLSHTKKGFNDQRGRLIITNIGLFSSIAAFALPWLAGMGGALGEAVIWKKYLLMTSLFLLGIGGAFLDVSMKPSLMAVSKKGDYQSRLGRLSTFKQIFGNTLNYIVPPVFLAFGLGFFDKMWDWTIFFPVYTIGSVAIASIYNFFKIHEQTLADEKEISSTKGLSLTKMLKELTGKQGYNRIIRRGVVANAFHGANMSIFGLFVNNLTKNHYDAFAMQDMYTAASAAETGGNMFANVFETISSSWLGVSLMAFTLPIIVGRSVGTRLMKKDTHLGFIHIKKQNSGDVLRVSILGVLAGMLLINAPAWMGLLNNILALDPLHFGNLVWGIQLAGIVVLALGLTNVSPIVNGYTTDKTRHVSDAVSALLSASSLVSFAISTCFGLLLDVIGKVSSVDLAWLPFFIPVITSLYLLNYSAEISKDGKTASAKTQESEPEQAAGQDLDINDALPN